MSSERFRVPLEAANWRKHDQPEELKNTHAEKERHQERLEGPLPYVPHFRRAENLIFRWMWGLAERITMTQITREADTAIADKKSNREHVINALKRMEGVIAQRIEQVFVALFRALLRRYVVEFDSAMKTKRLIERKRRVESPSWKEQRAPFQGLRSEPRSVGEDAQEATKGSKRTGTFPIDTYGATWYIHPLPIMERDSFDKVGEPSTQEIIDALEDPRYRGRTVQGIARQLGYEPDSVKGVLSRSFGEVIRLSARTKDGDELYITRRYYLKTTPFLRRVIAALRNRAD